MLPRKNRISRKEFPAYSKQGIRVYSSLFSAVVYPKEHGVNVSVVISKKTAPKAVTRNKLRRQFYAIIETIIAKFPRGATIVLYPKADSTQTPFHLLKNEVEQTFRKAKIL